MELLMWYEVAVLVVVLVLLFVGLMYLSYELYS